jgi:hypothetical protein
MSSSLTPTVPVQPEEVVQQLRALRAQIPDFVQLSRSGARSLSRVANVDAEFLQTTINAIGASDALRSALGKSAEELRQDTEFTTRWGSVAEELAAMLSGVNAAITVRRHRAGLTALQAYNMSRQLVRQKEHAHLLPHVEAMKRRTKFGRNRTRPATSSPPVPVPALQQ